MASLSSDQRFLLPNGFGNVGVQTIEKRGDSYFVRRTIDVHPADMQIKLPTGPFFPWKQVPSGRSLEFQASLPPGTWGTLVGLANQIQNAQKTRNGISEDDKLIILLKDVYQQLIVATSEAHKQGCRLGLLDPTNVLFVRDDVSMKTQVFLPDVGFIWKKGLSVPHHLTKSRWGTSPNPYTVFEKLWYPLQTLADSETMGNQQKETIALGRMLTWVLCGKVIYEAPTKLPFDVNSAAFRSWQVLEKIVDSRIQIVNISPTLKDSLLKLQFWKSFTAEPMRSFDSDVKRSGRKLSRLFVFLLMSLLIGTGVAYYYREPIFAFVEAMLPPKPIITGVCPECNQPSPFTTVLSEIDGDSGSFAKLNRVLNDGLVANTVLPMWKSSTDIGSHKREDFRELESKHFLYVADLLGEQMAAMRKLKEVTEPAQQSHQVCIDRLALQIRNAIDRTDGLMQWSEYYDRGLDSRVIEKIARVAVDLKTEFSDSLNLENDQWPKFLQNYQLRDSNASENLP